MSSCLCRRLLLAAALVLGTVLPAAAQEVDHSSPEAVLKSFVDLINAGETKAAFAVFHPSDRELAEQLLSGMPEDAGFEILERRAEDAWAVMRCKLTDASNPDGNVQALTFHQDDGAWFLYFGFSETLEVPAWIGEQAAAWNEEELLASTEILELTPGETVGPQAFDPMNYPQYRFTLEERTWIDLRVAQTSSDVWIWSSLYNARGELQANGENEGEGMRLTAELDAGTYRFDLGLSGGASTTLAIDLTVLPAGTLPEGFEAWDGKAEASLKIGGSQSASLFLDVETPGTYLVYGIGAYTDEYSELYSVTPSLEIGEAGSYGWGLALCELGTGSTRIVVRNDIYENADFAIRLVALDDALPDAATLETGPSQTCALKLGAPTFLRIDVPTAGEYQLGVVYDSFESSVNGAMILPDGSFLSGIQSEYMLEAGEHILVLLAQDASIEASVRFAPLSLLREGESVPILAERGLTLASRIELDTPRKLTVRTHEALTLTLDHEWNVLKSADGELSMTVPAGTYTLKVDVSFTSDDDAVESELTLTTAEPELPTIPEGGLVATLDGDAASLKITEEGGDVGNVYFELSEGAPVVIDCKGPEGEWVEAKLFRGEYPLGWLSGEESLYTLTTWLAAGVYRVEASVWLDDFMDEGTGVLAQLNISVRTAPSITLGGAVDVELGSYETADYFLTVDAPTSIRAALSNGANAGLELYDENNEWISGGWEMDGEVSMTADLEPGTYQLRVNYYPDDETARLKTRLTLTEE